MTLPGCPAKPVGEVTELISTSAWLTRDYTLTTLDNSASP